MPSPRPSRRRDREGCALDCIEDHEMEMPFVSRRMMTESVSLSEGYPLQMKSSTFLQKCHVCARGQVRGVDMCLTASFAASCVDSSSPTSIHVPTRAHLLATRALSSCGNVRARGPFSASALVGLREYLCHVFVVPSFRCHKPAPMPHHLRRYACIEHEVTDFHWVDGRSKTEHVNIAFLSLGKTEKGYNFFNLKSRLPSLEDDRERSASISTGP